MEANYLEEPEPFHDGESDGQIVTHYTPKEPYFANKSGDELGDALWNWVEWHFDRLTKRRLEEIWQKSYRAYYGLAHSGHASSEVINDGEQGELSLVMVNQYRSLVRGLLTMTTKSRPAFQARATNNDHRSLEQTHVAQGTLEYYMREKKGRRLTHAATESGILFGEGFIVPTWDSTAGPIVNGTPAGDIRLEMFTPVDTIRDWRRPAHLLDWYILRRFENRYDLMQRYPEFGQQIEDIELEPRVPLYDADRDVDEESDDIPVYEFFHKPTDAVPEGRHAIFCSPKTVFFEGALPYEDLPPCRLAPAEFIGSSFGYSEAWDLLGLQQVLDGMVSTIVTNYETFGVQNVAVGDDYELESDQLSGALRVWKVPVGSMEPKGVQLTKMPDGILEFCQTVIAWMEVLSGVNSVARGNVEAMGKGMSGSALALIQSMAVEYNSALQASYAELIEDLGTKMVQILKRYADTPRMVAIAGVDEEYATKMFSGADIELVERVHVEPGNPVTQSSAGRWELAQMIIHLQAETGQQFISTPEQLIQILRTGQLNSMTTGPSKEMSGIKLENELLARGAQVILGNVNGIPVQMTPEIPVNRSDNHMLHWAEHKQVVYSPEARRNPMVVQATEAHMEWHEAMELAERQRKTQLEMLFSMMGAGVVPPQGGDGAPAGPMPSPGGNGAAQPANGPQTPEQANMPNMPTNPLTGESSDIQAGGQG